MSPLPHVGDGVLPAHIEEQRTRVSVRKESVEYPNTVEYAGTYFASGVDNSFTMDRFTRELRIHVQSLEAENISFDVVGIDAAIANAFRRILLSEVPTMAIEKVFVLNNSSMIEDEVTKAPNTQASPPFVHPFVHTTQPPPFVTSRTFAPRCTRIFVALLTTPGPRASPRSRTDPRGPAYV